MSFTQVNFSIESLPVSKREVEKGIKDKLRFTHPQLMSRVTSDIIKQNISFLEGYWTSLYQEIIEPYNKSELADTLIDLAIGYTIYKLTK